MHGLQTAYRVFNEEIDALIQVRDSLDETFNQILQLVVGCRGKVIITGMGKSGHIARKISATMASLGIQSFFLHPAEAAHGDLGMIGKDDLVIAISYSGESSEITSIVPNIRIIGAQLISITGNKNSTLARLSMIAVVFPELKEACHLRLAPTSSTTAALVFGDALSVAASEELGFTKKNFGILHPSGSLGKKLVYRVADIMVRNEPGFTIQEDALLKDAVLSISRFHFGIVPVLNESGKLAGILTGEDIQRVVLSQTDIYTERISDIMNRQPVCVDENAMAVDALKILLGNHITSMPVIEDGFVVGVICRDDITRLGIYI